MRILKRNVFVFLSVMFWVTNAHAADVYISDITGSTGDIITVPILIKNAPNEVNSFGIELVFDDALLAFKNASSSGGLAQEMLVAANLKEAGVLTVGGFLDFFSFPCFPTCPSGIASGSSGVLVNVVFEVIGSCDSSSLSLQNLADGFAGWTTAAGSFACGAAPGCTPGEKRACDSGLPGVCSASSQTCDPIGNWGDCIQTVQASAEICDGVDNDCNGDIDDDVSCDGTVTAIPLHEGWNLISLNLQPDNTTIEDVLSTISAKCNSVWAFNNDSWTVYYPDSPQYSNLEMMQAGWGYWLNMNDSAILTVSGSAPPKTVELAPGWNLMGCNTSNPMLIGDAMNSITGKYQSVWGYPDSVWQAYYPVYPEYSDLPVMKPRYGFWIKTTENCTWTLP